MRRGRRRKREPARDLRQQYLEVVKLAVLDLTGTTTGTLSMATLEPSEVPIESPARQFGGDWPATALTMIGRRRLDHLQTVVEEVVRDDVPGDLLEAGVWRGGASLLMKAVLSAYDDLERRVVLADSFTGVPRPESPQGDGADILYEYSGYLGVPKAQVQSHFARYGLLDDRVEFVKGLFAKTMPKLKGRTWSVLRLDGDLYESVMPPLEHLYDDLSPGGFVIVDDYAIPQAARATEEFRERLRIAEPLQRIDETGVFWRKV